MYTTSKHVLTAVVSQSFSRSSFEGFPQMRHLSPVLGFVFLAVILGLSSAIPHYLVISEFDQNGRITQVATTARGIQVSHVSAVRNSSYLLNSTLVAVYPSAGLLEEPQSHPTLTIRLIFSLTINQGIKGILLSSLGSALLVDTPLVCGKSLDTEPFWGSMYAPELNKYSRNSSIGSLAPVNVDETLNLYAEDAGCNYPQDSNPFQYLNLIQAYPRAFLAATLFTANSSVDIAMHYNMTAFPTTIYRYREAFYIPLLYGASISLLFGGLVAYVVRSLFRIPDDFLPGKEPPNRRT
jgi:hypothetical protein